MQLELSKDRLNRRQFIALSVYGAATLAIPSHLRTGIRERIVYSHRQSNKNLLVNIGDSIARGGVDPNPVSPADLIAVSVNQKLGAENWRVLNLAQVGVTTPEVIKHQLLDPKLAEIMGRSEIVDADFIIHTGANDIGKKFAGDEERITRLREKLVNFDFNVVKSAFDELNAAVESFKEDFVRCLDAINILFGKKIRHLIVISPPDFSQAPRINSYTNGKVHSFTLDNPVVQWMVKEGCNELKSAIDNTVKDFPLFQSITVPTTRIGRLHFEDDQHLNKEGKLVIAKEATNRIIFPNSGYSYRLFT